MSRTHTSSGLASPRTKPRDRPAFLEPGAVRLLLFGGKGGVGKTTCATGTALHWARLFPDQDYLLASTDPAHSLQDCLAGATRPPNLEVRELDAQESLRQFKAAHAGHLRQIAQRGTFLDDDDIGKLLDLSLPGLDELMAFIELAALAKGGAYGGIIVDTAPTGHTLRLLGLPDVLRKWLGALDALVAKHRWMVKLYSGRHRPDDAERFLEEFAATIEGLASLLADPRRCCFVPVTLAEPLVTDETVRLVQALERLGVPVREIVVNRACPVGAGCPPNCADLRGQAEEIRRIRAAFPGYRLWSVPFQAFDAQGDSQLAVFWDGVRDVDRPESAACDADRESPVEVHPSAQDGPEWSSSPRVEHPARLPATETSLLFFAGKGGVGKTTLASATALRLAQEYRDRQILLFSVDPAHSLSDCLGTRIGPSAVRLNERLSAIEIDAEGEFADLKKQYAEEVEGLFERLTESAGGLDVAFDREVAERIMDLSPPGIDEVMALARVIQFLEAKEYDTFVCDTAPTGHLIRLLELPALVQRWLGVFFGLLLKYKRVLRVPRISELLVTLSKRLKVLRSLLVDPHKTSLHVVTIPTEMAYAETCDLLTACRQAGIHVPALFVNMVRPAGACPVGEALTRQEAGVCAKFSATFEAARPVVVYRGASPRGLARLTELGQALYCT
jgi:arsenite-transporting ATPase